MNGGRQCFGSSGPARYQRHISCPRPPLCPWSRSTPPIKYQSPTHGGWVPRHQGQPLRAYCFNLSEQNSFSDRYTLISQRPACRPPVSIATKQGLGGKGASEETTPRHTRPTHKKPRFLSEPGRVDRDVRQITRLSSPRSRSSHPARR